MTANAMVGDREAVLAAGMDDHIAKPIVVDEMFATLARWVKPRRPAAGIDSASGLANVRGNEVLYRRMLGMFRDRETAFVPHFQAALATGDADAAMRSAHDLKCEAGTLGMPALQEAAAALEQACVAHAGDAGIGMLLHEVSRQLDKVLAEI
jgi:HPt (histidine-containing phosphotransfer) domain-containing protein